MKKLYFSVLLILTSTQLCSQHLAPPIHKYSSVEYDGASQNWAIEVDERGIIYAANNQGLLSFDGQRWELFPLKNGATIRSVLPHEDRVYTGSYQEFGYWKRDLKGEMHYTSLMPLLRDPIESEEFWEIIPHKKSVYFRSFGAIYKYSNEEIEVVKKIGVNKMTIYNDKLLIAVPKQGLFYLNDDGSIEPLKNQEVLRGESVVDIEVDNRILWIGTRDKLYKYNGDQCFLFPAPQLNKKLAAFEFNHIISIKKKELLIATVKNGVLHHELKTGNTQNYNRENGLQNNTVLGMAYSKGNLWLALDDGIDEVHLESSIRFFTDDTGELGAVYDLAFHGKKLYAASNTGVYHIGNSGIDMVQGAQGHTWNLQLLDDQLYANHNSGTFKIQNDQARFLDARTGSFQIINSPYHNKYFIGTYTGISTYDPSTDSILPVTGIRFPVKKLLFEGPSTLWAQHANEGIYRIDVTEGHINPSNIKEVGTEEVSSNSNIFTVNGQIAVLKDRHWYQYNKIKDTLEVFKEFSEYTNHDLLYEDETGYWFSNSTNNSIIYTNFKNRKLSISHEELKQRLVKGNESIIKTADSIYYLTLKDGFARIDLSDLIKFRESESLQKPFFKGFSDQQTGYDLNTNPLIPYKNSRSLKISVGHPGSASSDLRYDLQGSHNIKGNIPDGSITFQNLSHGDYKLKIFAITPEGITSPSAAMEFTVDAPWYFSIPMKMLYIMVLLLTVLTIYLLNKRKLRKHRLLLEEELKKEHEAQMEQLEKKRLKDEIMMKRKELANTTMIAAKKNEVLMDIQGELNKDRDKFSNQYRLKHIMNKINQAIKDKDEWQVFETNFKEVHEDFSKDLLEKYPKLTAKDLKLCSYLKMNLTSKEIAPLMGKSLRGVEVHRYRLRKKMDLDSQENLTAFLIKNF